ncbi:MAG: hypothetical protein ACLTR5_05250 [Oscillospiraceae bacterium]
MRSWSWASPDAKGRRKPVGTGKFETIEVTSVIGAIGQRVDLGRIAPEAMAFNRNGTVQADGVDVSDRAARTSLPAATWSPARSLPSTRSRPAARAPSPAPLRA